MCYVCVCVRAVCEFVCMYRESIINFNQNTCVSGILPFFAPPLLSPSLVTDAADDEGRFYAFQFVLMHARIFPNQAHVILNAHQDIAAWSKGGKGNIIENQ